MHVLLVFAHWAAAGKVEPNTNADNANQAAPATRMMTLRPSRPDIQRDVRTAQAQTWPAT
jgi:hypothetical protein